MLKPATKSAELPGAMISDHPQVTIEKAPIFHTAVVLAVEENNVTRKSREAVEIRDRKPSVSKCKGWYLT